jgi:putative ABC transport system permease protein
VRAGNPAAAIAAARARATAIDPDLTAGLPHVVTDAMSRSARAPRFLLLLLGLFAGVAALLSAIGVYGLVSYTFAQRTREIAVRISLGAGPRQIFGLVASGGVAALAVGSVAGVAGSFAVTRVVGALLPQMDPLGPTAVVLAWALLLAIGSVACYLPARRALRVDPVDALRTS